MQREDDADHLRPASPAIHAVAALRDIRIRVSDGLELSANLWLPEPLPERGWLESIPRRLV
jgi:hypothetical protein